MPADAVPHRGGAAHLAPADDEQAPRTAGDAHGGRSAGGCRMRADAGDVLSAVDILQVVYCMGWPYDDPAGPLAERSASAPPPWLPSIGGTVPSRRCGGRSDPRRPLRRGRARGPRRWALPSEGGERPAWSHRDADPQPFPFEAPFHPAEVAHEVFQAWLTFAMRDIARRPGWGWRPRSTAARWAPAGADDRGRGGNPHAWFQPGPPRR